MSNKEEVIPDVDLVILDIDGVVLDSWPAHHKFLCDMASKHDLPFKIPNLPESYRLVANGMVNVLHKAGFGWELSELIIRNDYSQFGQNYPCPLFAGAEETILRLKMGRKLAIVSSNEIGNIERALGPITNCFNTIVARGKFASKKEGILHCLKENNVPKERAVFIGDTMADHEEAHEAEIRFVAAGYGWQIRPEHILPCPIAESFPEIGRMIMG